MRFLYCVNASSLLSTCTQHARTSQQGESQPITLRTLIQSKRSPRWERARRHPHLAAAAPHCEPRKGRKSHSVEAQHTQLISHRMGSDMPLRLRPRPVPCDQPIFSSMRWPTLLDVSLVGSCASNCKPQQHRPQPGNGMVTHVELLSARLGHEFLHLGFGQVVADVVPPAGAAGR